MWVFPLGAALVSSYFSGLLATQFRSRPRPNLLAWSIALGMFGVASGAAAVGALVGWSPLTFRIYYLFGAVLNVPVLALGTLYLLAPRRVADGAAVVTMIASIGAAVVILGANLNPGGLATEGIPRGSEVLSENVRMLSATSRSSGFWSSSAARCGRPSGLRANVSLGSSGLLWPICSSRWGPRSSPSQARLPGSRRDRQRISCSRLVCSSASV